MSLSEKMKNFKSFVVSAFCILLYATLVSGSFVKTDQVEKSEKNVLSSFVYDVAKRQNGMSNCTLHFVLQSNYTKEKNSIIKPLQLMSFG